MAAAPFVAVVDEEQVRAAVTVALDAAMAVMMDEIAKRVVATLATRKSETAAPVANLPRRRRSPRRFRPQPVQAAPPAPPAPIAARIEPVRRVNPLRLRSNSILGLDISRPEPEASEPERE